MLTDTISIVAVNVLVHLLVTHIVIILRLLVITNIMLKHLITRETTHCSVVVYMLIIWHLTNQYYLYIPMGQLVDVAKELERIAKQLDKTRKLLAATEGKLANQGFVSRAPEALVNAEREKAQPKELQ